MSTQGSPPGWHPDPAAPGQSVRWWDGSQWTAHTQPVGVPASPPVLQAPVTRTFAQANTMSLATVGLVALYVVLALATHFVLLGILPLALAVRAFRGREPLAPLAIAAAVLTVVVAVIVLARH